MDINEYRLEAWALLEAAAEQDRCTTLAGATQS